MARPPTPLGTYGRVSTKQDASGKWTARTRFRDFDGVLRLVEAAGTSISGAENALRCQIRERVTPSGDGQLTRDTKLSELAAFWLRELQIEGRLAPSTLELYERDTRNLVLPALGELRLRELTVGRVDAALKSLARQGVSKGVHARSVLSSMLGLATRHDAIPSNPVRDTSRLAKSHLMPRALSLDELHLVRTAIAEWRAGEAVVGPPPDGQLGYIIEVMLGTSTRIGEVLALRKCDVDVSVSPATVTIAGTLVNIKGRGLYRQDHPKKARQARTVAIPDFAADAIRDRLALIVDEPDETLLFRSRRGTPLWPNNVRRQWREIRARSPLLASHELDDVTPHTFRKTVATTIARTSGAALAAEMLGHSSEEITKAHYISPSPMVNPATAAALESLAPRSTKPGDREREMQTGRA